MPRDSSPTIQEFRVRAVRVPMKEPHQTASGVLLEKGGNRAFLSMEITSLEESFWHFSPRFQSLDPG